MMELKSTVNINMKSIRDALVKLALIVGLLFCFGCQKESKESNTITVLVCSDTPPYVFKVDNILTGFEVEVIQEIANKIRKKVVFKETYYLDMLRILEQGKADCAICAISSHEDEKVESSMSYLNSNSCILSHDMSGSQKDFGKSVSALIGSHTEKVIAKLMMTEPIIKTLQSNAVLVEDFLEKNSHFFVTDKFHAREVISKNASHSILCNDITDSVKIAILLNKSAYMKRSIDDALIDLERSGVLEALRHKWNLPSGCEVAELMYKGSSGNLPK